MIIETISWSNITPLTQLMVELWPDCLFDEEYENCKTILNKENETCLLVRDQENYIAYINLSIRFDYVEGSDTSPVAYIEGMYVKENYRHFGVGKRLIQLAEDWGKQKGCKQLASDTELTNEASIDFHKKNGFLEVNRIVCFLKEL